MHMILRPVTALLWCFAGRYLVTDSVTLKMHYGFVFMSHGQITLELCDVPLTLELKVIAILFMVTPTHTHPHTHTLSPNQGRCRRGNAVSLLYSGWPEAMPLTPSAVALLCDSTQQSPFHNNSISQVHYLFGFTLSMSLPLTLVLLSLRLFRLISDL